MLQRTNDGREFRERYPTSGRKKCRCRVNATIRENQYRKCRRGSTITKVQKFHATHRRENNRATRAAWEIHFSEKEINRRLEEENYWALPARARRNISLGEINDWSRALPLWLWSKSCVWSVGSEFSRRVSHTLLVNNDKEPSQWDSVIGFCDCEGVFFSSLYLFTLHSIVLAIGNQLLYESRTLVASTRNKQRY